MARNIVTSESESQPAKGIFWGRGVFGVSVVCHINPRNSTPITSGKLSRLAHNGRNSTNTKRISSTCLPRYELLNHHHHMLQVSSHRCAESKKAKCSQNGIVARTKIAMVAVFHLPSLRFQTSEGDSKFVTIPCTPNIRNTNSASGNPQKFHNSTQPNPVQSNPNPIRLNLLSV